MQFHPRLPAVLQVWQHAIGTPVFRQLNGGFDQMA